MKKGRGGARKGAGRKALPDYLKKTKCNAIRLTQYKKDALKTLPVSLGDAIETALDEKYSEFFETFLDALRKDSENGPG